nr:hypothetical protein [Lautropia sp.]
MARRLLYGLAALVLLLAIGLAGGFWWLGSESGLQFVVSRLQDSIRAGGGELRIEGAAGSLHRGVRIDRFEWQGGGMQASGTGLVAGWSLPALLHRRLLVTELVADTVELRLAPPEPQPKPAEPVTMPGVFAVPLDLAVQRLAIGQLRVVPGSVAGEPVPDAVVVNDLGAKLTYQDARLAIEELGAVTAYGRLAGARLEIGDSPPHRLEAELPLQGEFQQVAFDLRLAAAGDLDRLQAELAGRVADADLRLDATLTPLAPMPLNSAELKLAELDLQRLLPAAPRTRIDAQLTMAPQERAGDWRGKLQLRNGASGRLSEGQLPLSSLQSTVALLSADDPSARQLQLRDLQLSLPGLPGVPGGGRISGSVDVFPGRTITLAAIEVPEILASLAFSAIDVAQFAPQAPATALDGSLSLERNDFALRLSQSRERMRAIMPAASAGAAGAAEVVVTGRLDEAALRLDEARLRLGESRLEATGTAGLSPPYAIAMKGSIHRIQPGQWLPPDAAVADRWRQGVVSGKWSVDGKVAPGLDALLSLAVKDSTLAGRPLAADLSTRLVLAADWSPVRLDRTAIDIRFGANRLRANGAVGGA